MNAEYKKHVAEVFCYVMEKSAFMFVEPINKNELYSSTSNYVQAQINFSVAKIGVFNMVVPLEMCSEIAANMLGMEPNDEFVMDLATDGLGEVLNMTCGNVLTKIVGEEAIFNLSVPLVSNCSYNNWKSLIKDADSIGFLVDDYPVLIKLEIKNLL